MSSPRCNLDVTLVAHLGGRIVNDGIRRIIKYSRLVSWRTSADTEIPAMTVTFALIQKCEIRLRHLGGDVKKPEQGGLRICPSLLLSRKSSKSVLTNMRRRRESRWVDEQTPSRLLFNVDSSLVACCAFPSHAFTGSTTSSVVSPLVPLLTRSHRRLQSRFVPCHTSLACS